MANNFERMLAIVNEVFDVKNDPNQLDITEGVIEQLQKLHPATLSELKEDDGPVVWILVIPTIDAVMHRFLTGHINEAELLKETPIGAIYTCVYLCSATVLPEYRRKGLAKRLTVEAIQSIIKGHPITSLFYWPFSTEGEALAMAIAQTTELPLYKKE